jgi:peptide deformylase
MVDTMYEAQGLGIAGIQVGIARRLVVIDVGEGPIKLINPEIVSSEGEETAVEGCLSIPGYQGMVKRPVKVTVEYTDIESNLVTLEAEGMLKKALCHEIDHLNGILYSDIADTFYEIPQPSEDDDEDEDEEDEQQSEETNSGSSEEPSKIEEEPVSSETQTEPDQPLTEAGSASQ